MNIEIMTPNILAIFILNIIANVNFIIPKSKVRGASSDSPNSCP